MYVPDLVLQATASLIRNSPSVRGLGLVYRAINTAMIKSGATPIVITHMRDGSKLLVDLRSETEIDAFYCGEYESQLIRVIQSLLNPNQYFFDIGGNVGFYTVSMGHFFKEHNGTGKVVAFEPHKANFHRLQENIRLNNLSNYCILYNIGLSSTSTDSKITLREDFSRGSQTGNAAIPISPEMDYGFNTAPIRLETLDDVAMQVLTHGKTVDIIKLDIEGHEDFCLQGGQIIIRTHRPTILMEVNKRYYEARGVTISQVFPPLIPEDYLLFHQVASTWRCIQSLDECALFDYVLMIPCEKLYTKRYQQFATG